MTVTSPPIPLDASEDSPAVPPPDPVRPVVHVITGSYGAGHDSAAREIGTRLAATGATITTWDIVDLIPWRIGRLLRWLYLRQLALVPRSWGRVLDLLEPGRPLHRWVTGLLGRLPARQVLRALADSGAAPAQVISTHPFASQVLGHLRLRDRLPCPVTTYLTDASVHALWVHPGVDQHLAVHDAAATQAGALGARRVTTIRPLVPSAYERDLTADERRAVRRQLDPAGGRALVLVVGGSLGIGELETTAREVLALSERLGPVLPVVACGQNTALFERLRRTPDVVALPWRDDLPDLIRAVDCVVQNSGGFTTLETLRAGTPLISYRCLPGHGEANAAALERSGLASWPRTAEQLRGTLAATLVAGSLGATVGWQGRPELVDVLVGDGGRAGGALEAVG